MRNNGLFHQNPTPKAYSVSLPQSQNPLRRQQRAIVLQGHFVQIPLGSLSSYFINTGCIVQRCEMLHVSAVFAHQSATEHGTSGGGGILLRLCIPARAAKVPTDQ